MMVRGIKQEILLRIPLPNIPLPYGPFTLFEVFIPALMRDQGKVI
jgi:hypothetical protein